MSYRKVVGVRVTNKVMGLFFDRASTWDLLWTSLCALRSGRYKRADRRVDLRHPLTRRISPTTDPRRLSRAENIPPVLPGFTTGRASPHSDTGLDPWKHSLEERERNYGQRLAPTAPTPRTSSNSLPPPLPPPSSMSKPPDATNQMERLLAVLGDFTDHVSSMASIHVQRDNAKKHLATQEAEFIKWRKQHVSFPPLAEQQEKNRANAQKELDDLDRNLKQHVKSRDQLAKAIAMSVISNQSEGRGESARVHLLEKELESTRSEIQKLRADVNQASPEYDQIYAVQRDFTKSQNRIADIESKLGRIMATSARPPVASPGENSTIHFEKQMGKLQEKLNMLQDRVDDIQTLKLDLSKSKQEVRDLNSFVNVQVDGLRELKGTVNGQVDSLRELEDTVVALKGTVVGEADDKGLIDVITSVEEDLDKHRAAMTAMNEELNGFQEELYKFGHRIATLDRGTSRRQTPQLAPTTKYDDSDIRSGLEAIKAEMTEFQTEVATVRREQEEKDELVAADIDAISNSACELNETVQTNRTEVEAAINQINASISTLQVRVASPVTSSNPPTPISLTKVAGKSDDMVSKKIKEALKHTLESHRDNISAHERAIQHLDDRFNNLTTDRLAQNMVHQMSQMYPYAANVQAEFELVKKRDEQIRHNFSCLCTKVGQLDKVVSDGRSPISPEQLSALQMRLDMLSEEFKAIRTSSETEHEATTNRINGIDQTVQIQTPQLRENISSLRKEVGALSAHIDNWGNQTLTDLGNVGIQVERLNEHCGLMFERQGGGSNTATLQQKLAMQPKLATSAANDDDVAGTPSGAAAVASASTADVETGDEDVLPAGMRMRRKYLKTKKRRRVEEEEENDELQGRGEGRSGE